MHETAYEFVQQKVAQYGLSELSTLEIGSYDVNGSIRPLFSGPYVGVDMREGPGVDVVAESHKLPFQGSFFDVVVSTSTLEHDRYFWKTIPELARVLSSGGHLVLTTTYIGWVKHEFPYDYWRFTEEAIQGLLEEAGLRVLQCVAPVEGPEDLFACAVKP